MVAHPESLGLQERYSASGIDVVSYYAIVDVPSHNDQAHGP